MSLDPDELLKHADRLAADPNATETDLRRVFSAAYYALFHFCLTASADMVLGAALRSTAEYMLVYRSVEHRRLYGLCDQLRGATPGNVAIKLPGGFGNIADFARITWNLYELRIKADYDPNMTCSAREVRLAISEARQAIISFNTSSPEQRRVFLTMLLFKSRKEGQTP